MKSTRIEIVRGDITKQKVDAIVNAANSTLLGGGGVDGAIHCAAGPSLLAECRTLGGCPTGEARITAGHELPARYIIHAVGPVWQGGGAGEAALLASCYRAAIQLAVRHHCREIAFPAICCGVYGYPWHDAARVCLQTVRDVLENEPALQLARWVLFGDEIFEAWQKCWLEVLGDDAR